jgi:two-component system sensor histidine kinase KdpD
MKSTLLAALAHDLKTPVATARAALENWEAAAGGSDKSRLAREQLQALTRRIEELMQVVRLDSGAALPRRQRVSCSEIVEASISRFGETLGSHGLSLDVPAREVRIDVDPVQVAEALGHGLENAARYSPPGSEIRVSVEEEKDSVVLRVADSGKGIPLPDRERVLERFVRLPSSAGVPGSGLGLAIARSLVELNGGQIRIGDSPAGGVLFEITFPRGTA